MAARMTLALLERRDGTGLWGLLPPIEPMDCEKEPLMKANASMGSGEAAPMVAAGGAAVNNGAAAGAFIWANVAGETNDALRANRIPAKGVASGNRCVLPAAPSAAAGRDCKNGEELGYR